MGTVPVVVVATLLVPLSEPATRPSRPACCSAGSKLLGHHVEFSHVPIGPSALLTGRPGAPQLYDPAVKGC